MERGVDIIEDEISTIKALNDLVAMQESGIGELQIDETGGAAVNYDENIL